MTTVSSRLGMTTEEFIRRGREAHGDKYDYGPTEYRGLAHKVKIICPTHGEFEQRPAHHLAGHGCRKCSGKRPATTEQFVAKMQTIHGFRYDYSPTVYVHRHKPIDVVCPMHGTFVVIPEHHAAGVGCPRCKH